MGENYIYGFCLQLQIRLRELSDSEDTLETIKKLLQMEVRGPADIRIRKGESIFWKAGDLFL